MNAHDQAELARALFEEIGDALFLLDPDTDRLIAVNPVAVRLTGFTPAELREFPATYLFRIEAAGGMQRLRGAFNKTMVFHGQDGFLLRTKAAAAWVPVNLTVSRLHVRPKPLGLIIARDDRDRRAALTQTRRVEAELRTVLSNSPAALWSAERSPGPDVLAGWQFRYVSPLLARLAGRPPEFLDHPLRWADAVHPADRDAYRTGLRKLLTGPLGDAEQLYRVQAPDGAVRWVRDRLQVVRDESGRPTRLDGCLSDVTEQRQAEEGLRQSEQRFRALVEKSRDGIMLLDEKRVIRYASLPAKEILGYDPADLVGRNAFSLAHPDDLATAAKRFAEVLARPGEDVPSTLRAFAADGSVRVIELNGCNRLVDPSVRAVVVNYRDVTERDRLEEQLRQSSKMEAVGRLAGGIAHDFNNLLTVILGNLELLRSGADPVEAAELMATSERAARQAAELTRQMLGFARRQPVRVAVVDLNGLLRESLGMLRRSIDPRIAVRFVPAPDLRAVAADPVQFQQVVMNLCLNARDAMPDGGTLTVETANATAPPAARAENRCPDGCVRLSVTDTGVGMTDEVRAKVFEPFFTTKDVGKGTGLGLAVVYGVAQAHGGWVECHSQPGRGSRFEVYLPCAAVEAAAPLAVAAAPAPDRGRGETVLVADDEPGVRELAKAALQMNGYRVLTAEDGAEAVAVFGREAGRIGVVILDATMPRMSGRQAFEAIRTINPTARVLFASGYPAGDLLADDPPPGTAFLHKPYTPTELATEVRRLLDAAE